MRSALFGRRFAARTRTNARRFIHLRTLLQNTGCGSSHLDNLSSPVVLSIRTGIFRELPVTARILDGNAIRDQIYAELAQPDRQSEFDWRASGLAAVLVGDNPASQLYVKKQKWLPARSWGWKVFSCGRRRRFPRRTAGVVDELNRRDDVDGILVQMPCPNRWTRKTILEAVHPQKDVDGFHPINVGHLVSGRPALVACTPSGVMEILRRSGIAIEGANAAVMGRSDIVGKPMALLLMHANATVTICHSKTKNLPEVVRRADIVVAAMGRAAMVTSEYIRPGATVIGRRAECNHRPRRSERIFANSREAGSFAKKGPCWLRRAPGCGQRRGRVHFRSRRRRPPDHRHAQ